MLKLNTNQFNKLFSKVQKLYTWDKQIENGSFINYDEHTYVSMSRSKTDGLWLYITKGDEKLISKFAKDFRDIRMFLAIVKALG